MKLLVSCIPYDGGKSGISVYVREVVRELAAQGHDLTLLCEPGTEGIAGRETRDDRREETSSLASGVLRQDRLRVVSAPRWTRRPVLSMLWHLICLPFWICRHRREFDGFVICAANRRVCAWYPLPTAATVHDLANFHIPGKYSRSRMFYLAHVLPFFAKRAQHLVAVSGATKADMTRFWHCRDEEVTVLYNGLSGAPGKSGNPGIPGTSGNSGANLLYISRIEHPGKNHVRLIEAYSRLPREVAEAHPLVLTGSDWKDAEAVHDAAAKSPHADLIRFTGFAGGEALERIWSEAGFYVFPSLFEGFGLSLVEAMAHGLPCACSNNGSLGEIAGDVAITFDPESVDDIAAALERLLTEPQDARSARVARGREWVKRFSWADHAKGLAKLLSEPAPPGTSGTSGTPGTSGISGERADTALLFGIPVARVTEAEAVERIIAMAKRRPSTPNTQLTSTRSTRPNSQLSTPNSQLGTRFIATLNVDFVSNAVRCRPFGGNDELWGYLKNADLVTADGMPVVLLSRLLRTPLPERVTGADMVPAICRRCAEEGLSVYVLGGDRSAVEEAFRELGCLPGTSGNPGSRPLLAGIDDSFVKLDEPQPGIVERINAARPDVLFVALGNPKQELWMGRNAARLDVGVMIGVGGTFNFIAGRVKRAPRWVQKCGLEWVYRIVQEPGRLWKRYAYGLVKFSWLSLLALAGGFREAEPK